MMNARITAILAAAACAAPLLAGATPLPFALTQGGAVEIKLTGYMARSKDAGTPGTLKESGFAVGYMTSINQLSNPGQPMWSQGQNNQSISFMMYGVGDAATMQGTLYGVGDAATMQGTGPFGKQVYNVGCSNTAFHCDGKIHLDFYLDALAGGTNPGLGMGGVKASSRTVFDKFGSFTDGQLLMRWEFTPGLIASPVAGLSSASFAAASTTMFQSLNAAGTAGTGTYLAKCASGPACTYFRSAGQASGADFFGVNTLTAMPAATPVGQNGWITRIADPVIAQVNLPEPGALLLATAGLLALRARRKA